MTVISVLRAAGYVDVYIFKKSVLYGNIRDMLIYINCNVLHTKPHIRAFGQKRSCILNFVLYFQSTHSYLPDTRRTLECIMIFQDILVNRVLSTH